MDRRMFIRTAATGTLMAASELRSFALPAADTETIEKPMTGHGPLGERYELTLRRVLSGDAPAYSEEFLLADVRPDPVRRFTEYSGDLSGRYIGALATAAQIYQTPFPKLEVFVTKVIALQKPDGYFGSTFHYDKPTDNDLALLWGNGRLLVGLVEYYHLRPSDEVLAACKRLGDFLVRIGPLMLSKEIRDAFGAQHFASSYICWMQQTEGLARLYVITKDERYRKLAEQVAAVVERRAGDHVHGYLTGLRGVMDLYKATGDERFLRQCEAAWQQVAESQDLLITGGVPEGWSPNGHRTEGCAEADWVRLSLSLWKATGNAKYLAMAERAIFNELAFNQFATGDFGHRLYSETGLPGNGAARAWWCCTLHGLRAFPDIHASVFRTDGAGVWFDHPVDSRVRTAALSAVSESSLAEDGIVRITVSAAGKEPVALRIRKPEWAHELKIRVNGIAREFPVVDGGARVERKWAPGDVVEVRYGMALKTESAGNMRIAYRYGPWLLGAAASDNPAYFNELTVENRLVRGKETALKAQSGSARGFDVPIAATAVPYVSAEYSDQPGTVVLRAIGEQAGERTTAWELRFRTQENS